MPSTYESYYHDRYGDKYQAGAQTARGGGPGAIREHEGTQTQRAPRRNHRPASEERRLLKHGGFPGDGYSGMAPVLPMKQNFTDGGRGTAAKPPRTHNRRGGRTGRTGQHQAQRPSGNNSNKARPPTRDTAPERRKVVEMVMPGGAPHAASATQV